MDKKRLELVPDGIKKGGEMQKKRRIGPLPLSVLMNEASSS